MTTLTPTKAVGATAKAVGVLYVEPAITIVDDDLAEQIALEDVNVAFVADFLSACLTHERCGVHLYRAAFEGSNNPVFKARYAQFGEETLRHVERLEEVVTGAGGNPNYVSPMARATQASDGKILEATYLATGTLDLAVRESAILDAVLLAETIDHANWQGLAQLCGLLPQDAARSSLESAVDEVLAEEDEHLAWAQQTRARLTMLQAQPSLMAKEGRRVEDLAETVKGWFSDDAPTTTRADLSAMTKDALYVLAQERDIPGRSEMNKDQLLRALRKK
ncbi:MAG TPA: hypothetical protein VM282_26530 [Acidimicrobiales bacterium]|nr:hypothetical protein [Acidimicrobiales bacterium]